MHLVPVHFFHVWTEFLSARNVTDSFLYTGFIYWWWWRDIKSQKAKVGVRWRQLCILSGVQFACVVKSHHGSLHLDLRHDVFFVGRGKKVMAEVLMLLQNCMCFFVSTLLSWIISLQAKQIYMFYNTPHFQSKKIIYLRLVTSLPLISDSRHPVRSSLISLVCFDY